MNTKHTGRKAVKQNKNLVKAYRRSRKECLVLDEAVEVETPYGIETVRMVDTIPSQVDVYGHLNRIGLKTAVETIIETLPKRLQIVAERLMDSGIPVCGICMKAGISERDFYRSAIPELRKAFAGLRGEVTGSEKGGDKSKKFAEI